MSKLLLFFIVCLLVWAILFYTTDDKSDTHILMNSIKNVVEKEVINTGINKLMGPFRAVSSEIEDEYEKEKQGIIME